MAKKNPEREVKCWKCQRTLEAGDTKLGLCPKCINKYGSPAATFVLAAFSVGVGYLAKNGEKIANGVINIAKNRRS